VSYQNNAASAYAAASKMVSSLGAVVLLYDAMIQAMGAAKIAIEEGRVEDRFDATQKATKILVGLQSNLDMEQGGDTALMLHQFYNTLFNDIQRLNLRNSVEAADKIISSLIEVRRSWKELEVREQRGELDTPAAPNAAQGPAQQSGNADPAGSRGEQPDSAVAEKPIVISV